MDQEYEGILMQPTTDDVEAKPLIVIPHGGPHSASTACWLLSSAFFASLGYATLRINYRGSLGFGEEFLRSLPGKVGTLDVRDCQVS